MPKTCIIAEAGVNHNGSLDLARKLVDAAADAGADIVKFQTFSAKELAAASATKASYQQQTTGTAESQVEMLQQLELKHEYHSILMEHCAARGIQFLSTPFDLLSINFLHSLGMPVFKIPSGEITNLPYLRIIGGLGKDIILSTGMSTLDEVGAALAVLEAAGSPRARITLLHCTTEYPTPFEAVNLHAMQTMQSTFAGIAGVGYSDHTRGIEVPIAAVALGAIIIEKHFTLDSTLPGPDHKASLEPQELAAMVRAIRHIEMALGDGIKQPAPAEIANMAVARKSLVAATDIAKGDIFTVENLTTKRPGTGMSPMLWDRVLGTKARQSYAKDQLLCEE